jgi:hypothetical protein
LGFGLVGFERFKASAIVLRAAADALPGTKNEKSLIMQME